jgi:Chromatin remodelling complex Rsc7/Swp82 subunit
VSDPISNKPNEDAEEYPPHEIDEAGENKIWPNGTLRGDRRYKCQTFLLLARGLTIFMLANECAKILNYENFSELFIKNKGLIKITADTREKDVLISRGILPSSCHLEEIAIVTARSIFRQFGSKIIINGKPVRDDYWEAKAWKQYVTEDDSTDEKRAGTSKAEEATTATAESTNAAIPVVQPQRPTISSVTPTTQLHKQHGVSIALPDSKHDLGDNSLLRHHQDRIPQSPTRNREGSESSFESDSSSDSDLSLDWDLPQTVQFRLKLAVVGRLVKLYASNSHISSRNHTTAQQDASRTIGQNPSESQSTPSEADTPLKKSQKRKRDESPDDEDNKRDKPPKPPNELDDPDSSRLLACPFYKNNPIRYRCCRTKLLRSIPRVKYHLRRCHQVPIHCDRCSMAFETESARSEHLRQTVLCEVTDPVEWNAISEEQKRELSKRLSSKNSTRENWYNIYAILFPTSEAPNSPYLDGVESEELLDLLGFAEREGPRIIDELMPGLPESLRVQPEDINAFMQSTYQEFLSSLFERWESDRRTTSSGQPDLIENRTFHRGSHPHSNSAVLDRIGVPTPPDTDNTSSSDINRVSSNIIPDPLSRLDFSFLTAMDNQSSNPLQNTNAATNDTFESWFNVSPNGGNLYNVTSF